MPRKADPTTVEELLERIAGNIDVMKEMKGQGTLGSLAMAKRVASATKNDLVKVVSKLEKELDRKILEIDNERTENNATEGRKTVRIPLRKLHRGGDL